MNTIRNRSISAQGLLHATLIFLTLLLAIAGPGCTRKPQTVYREPVEPEPELPPVITEPVLTNHQRWQRLIRTANEAPAGEKIESVNNFFNQFDFIEDRYTWGKDDYWATLSETLARGGGDCEDMALAKYFTLLYLNIPDQRLRITYTISLKTKKPHMVLAFMPATDADLLVLDTDYPRIAPVTGRPDLVPVYSFNREGYWLARKQSGWLGEKIGSADRLSKWNSVLQRMNRETGMQLSSR